MALVGSARYYWKSFLRKINNLGQRHVTLLDEMQWVLSNKYAPVYYKIQLLDQYFLHCRKGSSTVREYLDHFKEYYTVVIFMKLPTSSCLSLSMVWILKILPNDIPTFQSLDDTYQ